MTVSPLPPPRRIVTGVDGDGQSIIVADGQSPAVITMDARPGYRNVNIWRTLGADQPVDAPDSVLDQQGVLPPENGTVIRVIDIPPESKDPEERRKHSAATFKLMFADADHHAGHARHPGMHTTATIDYAILLQGELVAVLDKEETVMRAGDILVQRGTSHAWANRSDSIARIAFVLTAAKPAASTET